MHALGISPLSAACLLPVANLLPSVQALPIYPRELQRPTPTRCVIWMACAALRFKASLIRESPLLISHPATPSYMPHADWFVCTHPGDYDDVIPTLLAAPFQ
jgi:hypothetical protein